MSRQRDIVTRVAHASDGDNRFRGLGVGADLVCRSDSWSVRSLAVGHRLLEEDERWLLDQLAVVNAVADPRIWPLKVARLVASFGAYVPALAAGYLSSDQGLIGPTAFAAAGRRLVELQSSLGDAVHDEQKLRALVRQRLDDGGRLEGFGVAFREFDERVEQLARAVEQCGRTGLPFWSLATALGELTRNAGHPLNIGGAGAAVMLDVGFSPQQIEYLVYELTSADFIANAAEASEEPAEVLRELPPDWVDYRGPPPRQSPRARGEE